MTYPYDDSPEVNLLLKFFLLIVTFVIVAVLIFWNLIGLVRADEVSPKDINVKKVVYEEIQECKYPSIREPVYNSEGRIVGYIIVQNDRC